MNCEEFRRQTQIDPLARAEELSAHEDHCPACAAFARDARSQEIRLRAVLREITPPNDLGDRVRVAARLEQQQRWRYAAAFGLLLLIGVGMVLTHRSTIDAAQPALVSAVLEHIAAESDYLYREDEISTGRLHWLFERFGAKLTGNLGRISFANECLMHERTGVHLIVPGRAGPVTVFFMPGESTETDMPIASEGLTGTIVPTGWGSIAVVGGHGEDIDGLMDRMSRAVHWPSTGQPSSLSFEASSRFRSRSSRMVARH